MQLKSDKQEPHIGCQLLHGFVWTNVWAMLICEKRQNYWFLALALILYLALDNTKEYNSEEAKSCNEQEKVLTTLFMLQLLLNSTSVVI